MNWKLEKPFDPRSEVTSSNNIDEAVQKSVLFSRLDDMIAWGRKNSIWQSFQEMESASRS